MKISVPLRVSHAVWFDGINGKYSRDSDHSKKVTKDSMFLARDAGLSAVPRADIQSKYGFITAVESLEREIIDKEAYIALCLDFHGDKKRGISFGDGTFLSWAELCDLLRKLNVACSNNLIVISVVCFGLHIINNGVQSGGQMPFYLYSSRMDEVNATVVGRNMPIFFSRITKEHPLHLIHEVFSGYLETIYSEDVVVTNLAKHYPIECFQRDDYLYEKTAINKFLVGSGDEKKIRDNILARIIENSGKVT